MPMRHKRCPRCSTSRPIGDFGKSASRKDGLAVYCKPCRREQDRQRYADPEKRERHLAGMREQYARNRARKLVQAKGYRDELRLAALRAYGGDPPTCACCGEAHVEFLEVDHVDGDGAAHRRDVGSSIQVLRWLRTNEYPPGFQILCRNCNQAKWAHGRCPHERER